MYLKKFILFFQTMTLFFQNSKILTPSKFSIRNDISISWFRAKMCWPVHSKQGFSSRRAHGTDLNCMLCWMHLKCFLVYTGQAKGIKRQHLQWAILKCFEASPWLFSLYFALMVGFCAVILSIDLSARQPWDSKKWKNW